MEKPEVVLRAIRCEDEYHKFYRLLIEDVDKRLKVVEGKLKKDKPPKKKE